MIKVLKRMYSQLAFCSDAVFARDPVKQPSKHSPRKGDKAN